MKEKNDKEERLLNVGFKLFTEKVLKILLFKTLLIMQMSQKVLFIYILKINMN